MLGYPCVRVKAVDNVEVLGKCRCLLGQVSCAAAADYQNVYLIFHRLDIVNFHYLCACRERLYCRWVTACEDSRKFHIIILSYSKLNASSEVSVSCDAYS